MKIPMVTSLIAIVSCLIASNIGAGQKPNEKTKLSVLMHERHLKELSQQSTQSNDLYWISFSRFFRNAPNHSGTRFLMQIDASGQVVIPPKKVVSPSEFKSAAAPTAITNSGENSINLWMTDDYGLIFRAEIDKQNLTLKQVTKTGLSTTNPTSLGVTQKTAHNFVLLERSSSGSRIFHDLLSRSITPIGIPRNKHSIIYRSAFDYIECGRVCGEAVSSDGKTALWDKAGADYHPQLTIQELDNVGHSTGRSTLVGRWMGGPNAEPLSAGADATTILTDNKIFIVYKNNGLETDTPNSQLFLRILNADNFEFEGDRILLLTIDGKFGHFGNVAIDPLGHFVIFSAQTEPNLGALFFLALDATGHPSGEPRVLLKNALRTGLDILRND